MDGEIMQVPTSSPTRTILQYLREDLSRCGTKEGCAEGDCGACTVVLGELQPVGDGSSRIHYQAINSCISLLPTLDAKQLITVESLAQTGEPLHPVQQALVTNHGSQCGFCTPGFVMSLFALYQSSGESQSGGEYQSSTELSRQDIDIALSGNLCRCTGYRSIVDAALQMRAIQTEQSSHFSASQAMAVMQLESLQRNQTLQVEHQGQTYFAPTRLSALAGLVEQYPDATLLAGGTDVGLWVTKQYRQLGTIIYLGGVDDLRKIDVTSDTLVIGAGVTFSELSSHLIASFPSFAQLLQRFASLPIRNSATLGGNIANGSPIGDSMPALMVAGASITLRRGRQQRELALEEFYLGYQSTALQVGEFVVSITIPQPKATTRYAAYKVSKRFDQDISTVCGAFRVEVSADNLVSDVRIAFGGVAAKPARAYHCEAALLGSQWNETVIISAALAMERDFQPISDMRGSAGYRSKVSKNLLQRFWFETQADQQPINVYNFGR